MSEPTQYTKKDNEQQGNNAIQKNRDFFFKKRKLIFLNDLWLEKENSFTLRLKIEESSQVKLW